MDDDQRAPPIPPATPPPVPPPRPSRAVGVLLILCGLPLLLPGGCSLLFVSQGGGPNPVAGIGFLIAIVGASFLVFGIWRVVSPPVAPRGEGVKILFLLILLVSLFFFGLWLVSLFSIVLRN